MPIDLLAQQGTQRKDVQPIDLLPKEAIQQQDGGIIGDIRQAGGFLPYLKEAAKQTAAIPVGAGQEFGRMVKGIPGSQFGLLSLLGKGAQQPRLQQLLAQEPQQAQVGKRIAQAGAFAAPTILGGPVGGLLGASRALPVLGRIAGGALGGALTSPESRDVGALAGAITATGLEGIGALAKGAPNLFVGKLAKNISKTFERQKGIGKELYSKVFKGTEDLKPTLSENTQQSINDLKELFPSKASKIGKAIDTYEKNPTIEGLHGLRSDLSKVSRQIGDKSIKSGLTTTEGDQHSAINNTVDSMVKDTQENLKKISLEKAEQYEKAQSHWRDNVVPFRNLNSIKKLLGEEKEVSPALFKDLAKQAKSPTRIRELTKVARPTAQLGSFLHRKYLGVPVWALLGAGLSSGTFFSRHLL